MTQFPTLNNFTLQVAVIFIAWYFVSSASSIVNKITLQVIVIAFLKNMIILK